MPGPPRGLHIGHSVYIRYFSRYGQPDDVKVGLIENHRRPDGRRCEGAVHFDMPQNADHIAKGRPVWKVEPGSYLTLTPSIQCTACPHHGFIRQGFWVPA